MALTINTNVPSLNAQRNLGKSQSALSESMQRLSSGLRINSAKDDAAGLAISDRMTSQIRGLNQAARNSNDGISLAQTAEGALQESTNILQRMRELAIQSANDTNSASDRASLQAEVNQLQQEMTRIASSTSFNGKNVLDGTLANAQFQVGANANETITFSIPSALAAELGSHQLESTNSTATSIEAATAAAADTSAGNNVTLQTLSIFGPESTAISTVDVALADSAKIISDKINTTSTETGVVAEAITTATLSGIDSAGIVTFKLAGTNIGVGEEIPVSALVAVDDLTALANAINDQAGNTGISATLSGDKLSIKLTQADGYDIKISDYAHSVPADLMIVEGNESATPTPISLTTATTDSTVIGGTVSFYSDGSFNVSSDVDVAGGSLFDTAADTAVGSTLQSIDDVDISTVEGASDGIRAIDGAIGQIDRIRGDLGALQNRFESTIANLENVSENLSAARSRILDADIAQETSAMTKNNILQQAGVAILTQANQTPQLALQLLQG
ncbi:MAG: flagellin [Proteobacteria bacterium]|nr:flagellin [Pseudomonadota bacterium]MBU1057443.1 flagellin [Pseudomonadota bacterium]